MSPLITAPARGYPDYQRIDNYDTGVIINEQTGVTSQQVSSNIEDVGRFACVAGSVQVATGPVLFQVAWYLDAAASILAGVRQFSLSEQITSNTLVHLVNMGPFVQVTAFPFGVTNYNLTALLFATNRVLPVEFMPERALLIDTEAVALNTGTNVNVYPGGGFAGPAMVGYNAGPVATTLQYQYLNDLNVWRFFRFENVVANTFTNETVVFPPGAWRINASNASGTNTTFNLKVTPSTTGAS